LGTKLHICLNIPYLVIHRLKKAYTVLETRRSWSVNVDSAGNS